MKGKDRYRQNVGKRGEDEAVRYLKSKDYGIVERNFRAERGEIDIIAKDGDTLVFVEVKTKAHEGFGEPEDWVDRRKQEQIGKVAMRYLQDKNLCGVDCRFDVVSVILKDGMKEIRHLEDAFWMESDSSESLY
ncbi:MAG: YraN family protein [bacterium]